MKKSIALLHRQNLVHRILDTIARQASGEETKIGGIMSKNGLKERLRYFKSRQKTLEEEEGRTSKLYTWMIRDLTAQLEWQRGI